MNKVSFLSALCGVALGVSAVASANAATTLEAVKSKGYVQCGVSQGLPGFSNADDAGNWAGIDIDLCTAVAAAVFGDGDRCRSGVVRGVGCRGGGGDLVSACVERDGETAICGHGAS